MTAPARWISFPILPPAPEHRELTQGLTVLPRGAITEILGTTGSGRTAVTHSLIASSTRRGEAVAIIDSNDAFDPASALTAGTELNQMLWVQCGHRVEIAMKTTDMILHSGGFGMIVLDLCDMLPAALNRVPISYWHRFRLAVENTPSVLLILSREAVARSCAARQFALQQASLHWSGKAPFQLIDCLATEAISRKPMGKAPVSMDLHAEGLAEA